MTKPVPSEAPHALPALLDVKGVAALLGCSTRHIRRLVDAGKMPPPIHIGSLPRWRKSECDQWIVDGCPSCRTGK